MSKKAQHFWTFWDIVGLLFAAFIIAGLFWSFF
jgi:hypothetical protein